jgi:hydroxymethylbilane synthase
MIPSPAQGAIAIVCREDDADTAETLKPLHHEETYRCVTIERDFLRHLHGGCSVPISALAQMKNDQILFTGAVHRIDGTQSFRIEKQFKKDQWREAGKLAAEEVKSSAVGGTIVEEIQKWKNKS